MKQFADFHLKSTTQRLLELEGFSEPEAEICLLQEEK